MADERVVSWALAVVVRPTRASLLRCATQKRRKARADLQVFSGDGADYSGQAFNDADVRG